MDFLTQQYLTFDITNRMMQNVPSGQYGKCPNR